jgi:hypothetical protein
LCDGNVSAIGISNGSTGTNNQFVRCKSYPNQATGIATIANGTTSVVVSHGLAVTPVAQDFTLMAAGTLSGAVNFWVDTITSTQFTIHAVTAPGADIAVAWRVDSTYH